MMVSGLLRRIVPALITALVAVACSSPAATPAAATGAATAPAPTTNETTAPSPAPTTLTTTTVPSDAVPGVAQLTIISGGVQMGSAGSGLAPAPDGAMLQAGDTVQTADGRAVITFSDGSTVEIEPSSALTIDALDETADGGIIVAVTLMLGSSWHAVSKLAPSSSYEVHTDASTAKVKGTAFQVSVDRTSGTPVATVDTTEGTVATTAAGKTDEVLVGAGSVTTVKKGDAKPAAPKAKPEPERKATVTIADENSVVVDPLGRANGFQNGRLILQTPGAHVQKDGGKTTVTLPDPPDGSLTTVVGAKQKGTEPDQVDVEAKIEHKGGSSDSVHQKLGRGSQEAGGVELKRSGDRSSLRDKGADKSGLHMPKSGVVPDRGRGRQGAPGQSRPPGASGQGPQGSRPPGAPAGPQGSRPPGAPEGTGREGSGPPPGGSRPPGPPSAPARPSAP